ncbi:MAG: EamA family transporter RarD [Sedimentitalea sp.]
MRALLAMTLACTIWGLSPLYYKLLIHVPPLELLAHRGLWSFVFFASLLALQGRLRLVWAALREPGQAALTAFATLNILANWFLLIYATQVDRVTETSLGYYIYPLVAVLIGRFGFGEHLHARQWLGVGLAATGVGCIAVGVGALPWISLVLAVTFGIYGVIKKRLPLGPVVSVTCEVLMFLPIAVLILAVTHGRGQGLFGLHLWDSALLMASGPITALPLILFSFAARRLAMSTVGLMQYINPTLQFICAVVIFAEPFTVWHSVAFGLIWSALALYSFTAWSQDKQRRNSIKAAAGESATVIKSRKDVSAKP